MSPPALLEGIFCYLLTLYNPNDELRKSSLDDSIEKIIIVAVLIL